MDTPMIKISALSILASPFLLLLILTSFSLNGRFFPAQQQVVPSTTLCGGNLAHCDGQDPYTSNCATDETLLASKSWVNQLGHGALLMEMDLYKSDQCCGMAWSVTVETGRHPVPAPIETQAYFCIPGSTCVVERTANLQRPLDKHVSGVRFAVNGLRLSISHYHVTGELHRVCIHTDVLMSAALGTAAIR